MEFTKGRALLLRTHSCKHGSQFKVAVLRF